MEKRLTEKAVLLADIGNVLLHVDREPSIQSLAERLSVEESILFPYFEDHILHKKLELGQLEPGEFVEHVLSEIPTDQSITESELEAIYGQSFQANEKLIAVIDEMRPDIEVILLSNTNHLDIQYIENKFNLISWADNAVLSYKVHMRKPDPGIYYHTINKFKLNLDKTLFIDDLDENIHGARTTGLNAEKYRSPAQVEKMLLQLTG